MLGPFFSASGRKGGTEVESIAVAFYAVTFVHKHRAGISLHPSWVDADVLVMNHEEIMITVAFLGCLTQESKKPSLNSFKSK